MEFPSKYDTAQELEVLSLSHLYSLKTKVSQCHMQFSVFGFRSDIRIELQAPMDTVMSGWSIVYIEGSQVIISKTYYISTNLFKRY